MGLFRKKPKKEAERVEKVEKPLLPALPEVKMPGPEEIPSIVQVPQLPSPPKEEKVELGLGKPEIEIKPVVEVKPEKPEVKIEEMPSVPSPLAPTAPRGPIFVKITKYKAVLEAVEKISKQIAALESDLAKLSEVRVREEENVAKIKEEIEIIKNKISEIQASLFSKLE
jgi:hypothetical protein